MKKIRHEPTSTGDHTQAYWWWAHLFISLVRAVCVIMAAVSLCHFCDRLSRCKSAAVKVPPTCTTSSRQRLHSHVFCYRLPAPVCHTTLHGYGLWEKLHVLCGMICNFLVPPALTVLFSSSVEKCSCVKRCICSLKIFGQWVLILG